MQSLIAFGRCSFASVIRLAYARRRLVRTGWPVARPDGGPGIRIQVRLKVRQSVFENGVAAGAEGAGRRAVVHEDSVDAQAGTVKFRFGARALVAFSALATSMRW
jgi:hypothetical protein